MITFKGIPLLFLDHPDLRDGRIVFLNPKGVRWFGDLPLWGGLAQILHSTSSEGPRVAKNSLDRIFTYHPPFGTQQERYVILRNAALAFSQLITDLCPPSREQSLALTDVQRACQMANAAIAINEVAPAPAETPSGITTAEPVINQESV